MPPERRQCINLSTHPGIRFNPACDGAHSLNRPMPRKHKTPLNIQILRLGFRWLGPWLPETAGHLAYNLWFSTRRFPEPPRERAWRDQAQLQRLTCGASQIATYSWADPGRPTILLVHGWNSRAMQLGAFVGPLLAAGFRVVGLDAPGHGRSTGTRTNIFEFADAIRCTTQTYGPLAGCIAHSFGVPATVRAILDGLELPRLVAIAAPAQAEFLLERFSHLLAIPENVITAMRQRVERNFGMDIFARLSTQDMLRYQSLPGLIIHDRRDRDVPVEHATQLQQAWPQAALLLTEGLGHTRILRDAATIAAAVEFLRR